MKNQFWHSQLEDLSFRTLQNLKREFDFVLVGGWAIYFYTKSLKSRDIDIIVRPEVLSKLKQKFEVVKNEQLRKYEIKTAEFDIDIYLPYYSSLGIPAEDILKKTIILEGFRVPEREILLILKIFVFSKRKDSLKGQKDKIDIISLLYNDSINKEKFLNTLKKYNLLYLKKELRNIFKETVEVEEINLNQKKFADLKKKYLNLTE